MLYSRTGGREFKLPRDHLFKGFGNLTINFFCKNWFYVFSLKISIEFSIKKKLLAEKGF